MMMTIANEILIGAFGSILGTYLVWLFIKLYVGWTSWPGIKKTFRFAREFTKAGGLNFFSSRKSYFKFKDHGTSSDYLSRTSSSLIYVGFWLAHGVEVGSITSKLKELIESNRRVTIVLMDPNSNAMVAFSQYMNLDIEEVKGRVSNTIEKLCKLYDELSRDGKERLTVKLHDIVLTSSAFLIDSDVGDKGKTLIDFKLYGLSRDNSFGIEFHKRGLLLYDQFTDSYLRIAKSAKVIDCSNYLKQIQKNNKPNRD